VDSKERGRRCEGTRVVQEQGAFKNAPCDAQATTTRVMNPEGEASTTLHYCDRCAADWDAQRELIAGLV
jgi:hypothetical protein